MLMLMFRVAPAITHPRYNELKKSAANMFVNCDDLEKADSAARAFLSQHHWHVEALLGAIPVKERPSLVVNRQLAELYDRGRQGRCCLPDRRSIRALDSTTEARRRLRIEIMRFLDRGWNAGSECRQ